MRYRKILNRIKVGDYWYVLVSDYYGGDKLGYVREHVYFYEKYHKCCMLDWGIIHHIDENKENNMLWNLQGMMTRDHTTLHLLGNTNTLGRHKDTSNIKCFACGSNKTYIRKSRGNKTPYPMWRHLPHDQVNWYCTKCYDRWHRESKKASLYAQ